MNPFVLKTPLVTEKTYRMMGTGNNYTFVVDLHATKGQIKEAIEKTFGVNVVDVHTTVVAGKTKRVGRKRTSLRLPDRKKAVVKVKEGQKIEVFDIPAEAKQ